jgi:hypothetical protein
MTTRPEEFWKKNSTGTEGLLLRGIDNLHAR